MPPRLNSYGQCIGDAMPDWTPRPHPQGITLTGRYCTLQPFNAREHAEALYRAYAKAPDGRDWTWMPVEPFADQQAYLDYAAHLEASRDPLHYTITDNQTGQPVGTLALMRIDANNGVVEVGHVAFSPLLKRTRIATEAQFLLMGYAFDTLGYRRYEWKCDSLNTPSRRAAERLGFHFEGTFRQAVVYKGRTRDTHWLSMLDNEWPDNKQALTRWLAEANFDSAGQQLHTLTQIRDAL